MLFNLSHKTDAFSGQYISHKYSDFTRSLSAATEAEQPVLLRILQKQTAKRYIEMENKYDQLQIYAKLDRL